MPPGAEARRAAGRSARGRPGRGRVGGEGRPIPGPAPRAAAAGEGAPSSSPTAGERLAGARAGGAHGSCGAWSAHAGSRASAAPCPPTARRAAEVTTRVGAAALVRCSGGPLRRTLERVRLHPAARRSAGRDGARRRRQMSSARASPRATMPRVPASRRRLSRTIGGRLAQGGDSPPHRLPGRSRRVGWDAFCAATCFLKRTCVAGPCRSTGARQRKSGAPAQRLARTSPTSSTSPEATSRPRKVRRASSAWPSRSITFTSIQVGVGPP